MDWIRAWRPMLVAVVLVGSLSPALLVSAAPKVEGQVISASQPSYYRDVPATQPWTNTGLVLTAGSKVAIEAGGVIHVQLLPSRAYSPAGDPTTLADSTFVAPGLPVYSLIGRIDNGTPFEVGTAYSVTVPASGVLYLGVNDQVGYFNDNSGTWMAAVKSIPAPLLGVPAIQPWTNTGLVLTAGSKVAIEAGGIIHVQLLPSRAYSPAGDPTTLADSTFVAPGLPVYSLIGRIDNGTPFEVGTAYSVTVPASGVLYLGVNDQVGRFSDNSGAWGAAISVAG